MKKFEFKQTKIQLGNVTWENFGQNIIVKWEDFWKNSSIEKSSPLPEHKTWLAAVPHNNN